MKTNMNNSVVSNNSSSSSAGGHDRQVLINSVARYKQQIVQGNHALLIAKQRLHFLTDELSYLQAPSVDTQHEQRFLSHLQDKIIDVQNVKLVQKEIDYQQGSLDSLVAQTVGLRKAAQLEEHRHSEVQEVDQQQEEKLNLYLEEQLADIKREYWTQEKQLLQNDLLESCLDFNLMKKSFEKIQIPQKRPAESIEQLKASVEALQKEHRFLKNEILLQNLKKYTSVKLQVDLRKREKKQEKQFNSIEVRIDKKRSSRQLQAVPDKKTKGASKTSGALIKKTMQVKTNSLNNQESLQPGQNFLVENYKNKPLVKGQRPLSDLQDTQGHSHLDLLDKKPTTPKIKTNLEQATTPSARPALPKPMSSSQLPPSGLINSPPYKSINFFNSVYNIHNNYYNRITKK